MLCAVAGDTAWENLSTLSDETTKLCNVLIINALYLVYAESANFFTRSSASVTLNQSVPLLTQWD